MQHRNIPIRELDEICRLKNISIKTFRIGKHNKGSYSLFNGFSFEGYPVKRVDVQKVILRGYREFIYVLFKRGGLL